MSGSEQYGHPVLGYTYNNMRGPKLALRVFTEPNMKNSATKNHFGMMAAKTKIFFIKFHFNRNYYNQGVSLYKSCTKTRAYTDNFC